MASINDRIKEFFEDMADDVVEERVVEYVVREVHNGRRLMDVIEDPYVKNRLTDQKREAVLQNVEIVEALEQEIKATFSGDGLGFSS